MRNKIILALLVVFSDQSLKYLARQEIVPQTKGFFDFISICNPFLSWGIPLEGLLFWLGWILAFLGLVFLILNFSYNWSLFLVLAGAVSNFIDRIFLGCVVDYLKVGAFPIFNLADVFIVGGVLFFVFKLIKK
ncbi:MAG: signal peptidase II [Candidatus Moraniibacteriota bacterium]